MKKLNLLVLGVFVFNVACAQTWGDNGSRTEYRDDAGLMGVNGAVSGFFQTYNPSNYPAGANSWWHLLDIRHSNPYNNYAMQIAGSFFDQGLYFRKTDNNASQPWQKFMATDDNDVLTSNNKLVIQTPVGQSFFTGHQLGGGYGYPQGIFRAITDDAQGWANYFFDGQKYDGTSAYNTMFSVRADGQGYFAGNLGVGTASPPFKLHVAQDITMSGDIDVAQFGVSGSSDDAKRLVLGYDVNGAGFGYIKAGWLHHQWTNIALQPGGGNVGIGTASPQRKLDLSNSGQLTFGDDVVTDSSNGLYWHAGADYGIYRTPGPWNGGGYQQLRIQFDTGIQLGAGIGNNAGYDKSFVEIVSGKGLMVSSGNVGIGTTDTKGYKLAVAGNAIAESMTVKLQSAWGDYVFKPTYILMPLSAVKTYIDKNQHLPEMPSAAQVEKDGINLGEMNKILVKKVEELTLYLIEQQKEIDQLKAKVNNK